MTRRIVGSFLRDCGFNVLSDKREHNGQTIVAATPNGDELTMRVHVCWDRSGKRDTPLAKTYSAVQLTTIKNDDWEASLLEKFEQPEPHGATQLLFVQREEARIVYAALVPREKVPAIWCAQRDQCDGLIRKGQLGRRRKNPAKNGTSATIYLQDDRAPGVAAKLWDYPGVQDLTKLASIRPDRLPDGEAYQDGPSDPGLQYVPKDVDRRQIVERQIRERRGQQQFRDALRKRFADRCLVTGCEVLAVLEAAHVNPYRGDDDHHVENGLLLRSDIHTLFDLDLIGIDPDELRVELHPRLAVEYGHLAGTLLGCPRDRRPSREVLKLRYEQFQQQLGRP